SANRFAPVIVPVLGRGVVAALLPMRGFVVPQQVEPVFVRAPALRLPDVLGLPPAPVLRPPNVLGSPPAPVLRPPDVPGPPPAPAFRLPDVLGPPHVPALGLPREPRCRRESRETLHL